MSSSNSLVIGWVDVITVEALTEFILILLTMVGIFPNKFTSPSINAGLFGLEVSIYFVLLASCFLCGFGLAYFFFDARVGIVARIGVGGVLHFFWDSIEVTLIKSLRIKFEKLVSLYLCPLKFLLTGVLLFLDSFSTCVTVSNSAAKIILHILCIIVGAEGVGGVIVVQHPISLVKLETYCFSLWYVLTAFLALLVILSLESGKSSLMPEVDLSLYQDLFWVSLLCI